MSLTSLLASVRTLIENNTGDYFLDRCTVYNVTYTADGTGGQTASDGAPVASNVPCNFDERTYQSGQVASGTGVVITHDLCLEASAATRAIKPNYAIVVSARDDVPQLRFENCVILEESVMPVVMVGAMLKK